jgi:hypothetical protein
MFPANDYHLWRRPPSSSAAATLELRTQRNEIRSSLTSIFPHITSFHVGDAVEWRRSAATSDWYPHILSGSLVRELLLRPDIDAVEDIDDLLKSVLSEEELTVDVRYRLGIDNLWSSLLVDEVLRPSDPKALQACTCTRYSTALRSCVAAGFPILSAGTIPRGQTLQIEQPACHDP